ncbi:MAG TPA: hypothetical protein VGA70_12395 [Longimicrobiales bacterium]
MTAMQGAGSLFGRDVGVLFRRLADASFGFAAAVEGDRRSGMDREGGLAEARTALEGFLTLELGSDFAVPRHVRDHVTHSLDALGDGKVELAQHDAQRAGEEFERHLITLRRLSH